MSISVTRSDYGRLPDGTAVDLFTLRNSHGVEVSLSSWGALITSVKTPDRRGRVDEITLAHDTLGEYLQGHPYYGALVGRVCNRISGGGFALHGQRYHLQSNVASIHLHGGIRGFDKQLYATEVLSEETTGGVRFTRLSPDGEEGYPGNLSVAYSVILSEDDRLLFRYEATTDAATIVNLTNHCYWNLSGESTILDHELQLSVTAVAEADHNTVPTGRFLPIEGTPFDFSRSAAIRPGLEALRRDGKNGYDHSLLIAGADPGASDGTLREAARVHSSVTGRTMIVSTTYPDVHFYSGNNLPGERGRDGTELRGQEALCLECQHFPDAPNRPEFPSIVLEPGQHYHHETEHRFLID